MSYGDTKRRAEDASSESSSSWPGLISALLYSDELSDCAILVKERQTQRTFPCHKLILCMVSKYFLRTFAQPDCEQVLPLLCIRMYVHVRSWSLTHQSKLWMPCFASSTLEKCPTRKDGHFFTTCAFCRSNCAW